MVSDKINILRKYLLMWIIWLGIMVYLFREMLGMVSVGFVVFTDRLLNMSDSFNPVWMWAIFGLLLGAIYGSLVATRKFKLDGKINQLLIGTISITLVVAALVNKPLANSLIASAERDSVQVYSTAKVQMEEKQQPQERKGRVDKIPTASQQEQTPEKVTKEASNSSISEIKELGGPVKVINETGGDLDLYISVYANDTESWKDFYLIQISSQGSPTINVKSDRYRYYVKQDGGDKYSPETPYTVSAYDGDFGTLIIK